MPFTVSEGNSERVSPGTYPAMLEAVTIRNIISSYGEKDMREWQFLVNVAGTGIPLSALSTQATGPGSKSYRWLMACLRRELRAGEQLDDPVGANVLVVVGPNKKGYSTILDVLPAPAAPEQSVLPDGSSVPR